MADRDDSDTWRLYQLSRCCRSGKVSDIDGVHFDLKHIELDRAEWRPTTLLGWPYGDDLGAPRLVFPWHSNGEKAAIARLGEAVTVQVGDRVLIRSVEIAELSTDLGRSDHPHHKQQRTAEVIVEKAGGEVVAAQPAWKFEGVADVMGPLHRKDYAGVRWALLARLAEALGIEDADEIVTAKSPDEWPPFAESSTELDRLAAEVGWHADGDFRDGAAVAFGYLMGRAEAREFLLPFVAREQQKAEKLRLNAKMQRRSGKEVREAALKLIDEKPDILLSKCAEQVATLLGRKDDRGTRRTLANLFAKAADGKVRPDLAAVEAFRARIKGS